MATKNRTVGLQLATTNSTIYTVPNNWDTTISSIFVANDSSSPVTFSLDWYDSASTTYYTIAEKVSMLPNSIIQITDVLYLGQGDSIRGLASAVSSVTVSIRMEEGFAPTQF